MSATIQESSSSGYEANISATPFDFMRRASATSITTESMVSADPVAYASFNILNYAVTSKANDTTPISGPDLSSIIGSRRLEIFRRAKTTRKICRKRETHLPQTDAGRCEGPARCHRQTTRDRHRLARLAIRQSHMGGRQRQHTALRTARQWLNNARRSYGRVSSRAFFATSFTDMQAAVRWKDRASLSEANEHKRFSTAHGPRWGEPLSS